MIDRRGVLAAVAGLSALAAGVAQARSKPAAPPRGKTGGVRLAAAWSDAELHRVGILGLDAARIRVLRSVETPTRAHGLLPLADNSLVAVARRPGDWLLRWPPAPGAKPAWIWAEPGRRFNGHAAASPDGRRVYTTETDLDTGASLIGVRDAGSLAKFAEWRTHGIDAHAMLIDGATLIVANGGVPSAPETGRQKLDLQRMDSSLVRLSLEGGELLGQWRLADPRLSLRHLAMCSGASPADRPNGQGPQIGIALQAEHDAAAERATAPVLAVFDGHLLQAVPLAEGQTLAGYGGDIAATAAGFAVSAPRAHAIASWHPTEGWLPQRALEEPCALAVSPAGLFAGGRSKVIGIGVAAAPPMALPAGMRLDNHWVKLPG